MRLAVVMIAALLAADQSLADQSPGTQGPDDPVSTVAGQYTENATFLGHGYVKSQSSVDRVPDLASKMQTTYMVNYWFTNVGRVDGSGAIVQPETELASVVPYLNAVNDYETANSASFRVLAWLNNGDSSTLDLTDTAVRSTIVNECTKLVSTTVDGSYIAGANRSFDGIMIDIEPSGHNDAYFNALKALMDEIKAAIGADKLVGVTPPKYGTNGSVWFWSPTYYYYMARHVDILCAMTYDNRSSSGAEYQSWLTSQATEILQAVSGEYWTDGSHPAPTNGVMVFIGLPAFPTNANHNPSNENIQYGAQGLDAAITSLINASDAAQGSFKGAAVFLHGDGSGTDGYASWDTDWWWFGRYWLAAW
jgi:glycosyl hydrolase family 18 (putative chitinase)